MIHIHLFVLRGRRLVSWTQLDTSTGPLFSLFPTKCRVPLFLSMTADRSDSAYNILFSFLTSMSFFLSDATFSSCVSMAPQIEKSLDMAIKKTGHGNIET